MKTFTLIIIATLLSLVTVSSQDCGRITDSCITASIMDMTETVTGTEIRLSISLSEDCNNNAVSHVSIGLPNDVSAVSPSDNGSYTSELTNISYAIENMTAVPFHCIKFNTIGDEGIKGGEEEVFVFTIPRGVELTEIPVEIKRGNISDIMTITLNGDCGNALPVELVSFEGMESGNEISLSWSTASEENSSHFEVQKSSNGFDWEVIGEVKSHENSTDMNYYVFNDGAVSNEVNYYRLRMVDLDETFEYSEMVVVRMEVAIARELMEVTVFPNPTVDVLKLDFKGASSSELNIRVLNEAGNTMYASSGSEVNNIDVSQYATGTYFLVVDNGTDLQTERFIKVAR